MGHGPFIPVLAVSSIRGIPPALRSLGKVVMGTRKYLYPIELLHLVSEIAFNSGFLNARCRMILEMVSFVFVRSLRNEKDTDTCSTYKQQIPKVAYKNEAQTSICNKLTPPKLDTYALANNQKGENDFNFIQLVMPQIFEQSVH